MKILFSSHYSFLYGSNRSMDSLIDYFILRKHDVEVLLPSNGAFVTHLEGKGVKTHIFKYFYEAMYIKWNSKYFSLPLLWIYNFFAFPFLFLKIKRINPDIIYSNSSIDTYSVWIAKILKKRHVIHIREFMDKDFGAHYIFGSNVKSWILKNSDKIICVSNAVANSVLRELPNNSKIIYNGVAISNIRHENPQLTENLKIGVVGNIDISKQQDLAIKIMPSILNVYPNITLHIIGDKECSYKRYIQCLVKELNIQDKVIFDGFINNVEEIYNHFDVLLMCSRSEAFGRVTVEAMLRNKPVIGYKSGGTTELIENGTTGFHFENKEDVIKALHILIKDRNKALSIINKARNTAEHKYVENVYVENVYNYVIGS